MTDLTLSQRELRLAESIALQLTSALMRRKLVPAFSDFYITHLSGMTPLIAVLNTAKLGDHAQYIRPDLLHQLSTDLGGRPVYLSNHSGLRYVVLLSTPPKLPHRIDLPADAPCGRLAVGMRFTGQPVLLDWENFLHMAVLGQTGSGKSAFLQLLAWQAIRDGMKLLLSDLDQTTFGTLENHPALWSPIAITPAAALGLIENAIAECDRRAALFASVPERPQKLSDYNTLAVKKGMEPLSRILVILDEASAILTALGGAKGAMGQALATLGWRGRKFGVHFIFAAQEFTKNITGPIRDQVGLSLCFRVRSGEMAKRMGCQGAERIPGERPGLAISDRHGPLQTYFIDPTALDQTQQAQPVLTTLEQNLFTRALAEGGKLPAAKVQLWAGISEWQARRMIETWTLKGWLAKDANRDNAFCLTGKIGLMLSNQQSTQTS